MTLRFRRGTDSDRTTGAAGSAVVFAEAEPVWVTDTEKLYIGDGTTAGGVLVNPSIGVDDTTPSGGVETVIVERSRSVYEVEDDNEIDLSQGNNFIVNANTALTISFANAVTANGQSGYIIVNAGAAGSAIFDNGTGFTLYTSDGMALVVAASTRAFISYTVATNSEIYISAQNPISAVT